MFRWFSRSYDRERLLMSLLSDLVAKITSDVDAVKSANASALAAKDAAIAQLTAELDALKASDADTQAAIVALQAVEVKLTTP